MAVMEIFVFTPFLFFFYFKGTVFTVIDCADTGIWWNWPWHKLHLSTSYLWPINISGEIFLCVCVCVNEVMLVGEKKDQCLVLFCCTYPAAGLSGMSSVADDSVLCPHMMQCTASPYFFELGLFMEVYQIYIYIFLLLFCCLSFVLKFSSCHKYTVYR